MLRAGAGYRITRRDDDLHPTNVPDLERVAYATVDTAYQSYIILVQLLPDIRISSDSGTQAANLLHPAVACSPPRFHAD
jgi:hypothetical protein